MSSTLSAHSPKFQSALTTLENLTTLPTPVSLGRNHKPVPHAVLVNALHQEIERRGYNVQREQLALGKKGAALFGVIDIEPVVPGIDVRGGERGISLGFRNATDRSMAIRGVAGQRVFVCDNLAMSGETFAISRKNTTGLDLHDAVARGFDKFIAHIGALDFEIARLQSKYLSDGEAKCIIYDVFAAGIVPVRLFDDVERFYFHPTDEQTDCQPRNAWGAANAFTRAIQDLTPTRLFSASQAIGKHFANVR